MGSAEKVFGVKGQRGQRSEVKGQGHMCTLCVNVIMAEAYISTVWRRGLFILLFFVNAGNSETVVSLF